MAKLAKIAISEPIWMKFGMEAVKVVFSIVSGWSVGWLILLNRLKCGFGTASIVKKRKNGGVFPLT